MPRSTATTTAATTGPDGSLLHRIIEGIMTEPALALGFNVASHSPHVMAFFDKIEGMIGPMLTGMAITTMGEMAQVKGRLKDTLVSKGVPVRLVEGFNGLIDEAFEGIWAARMARMARGDRNEQITDADVKAGTKSAKEKFAEAQRLERTKLMRALGMVDAPTRAAFLVQLAMITDPEQKKKFAFYRPFIEEKWLIEDLAATPAAQWLPLLEQMFGPYAEPSIARAATKALKEVKDGFKAIDKFAHDHGVSDPKNDPVNDKLRGVVTKLKRRRGVY